MTPQQKQDNFNNELLELLKKYSAEMLIKDFGTGYYTDQKIVVDFMFDEKLFEENETGIIPELILGSYVS